MMDIGSSSAAGFDRTRLPVRYYRVNFSRAQELPREADPRSASFCRDVCDCGAMFQTLVEEVSTQLAADSDSTLEPGIGAEDRGKAALACCGDDGGRVRRGRCSKVVRSAV